MQHNPSNRCCRLVKCLHVSPRNTQFFSFFPGFVVHWCLPELKPLIIRYFNSNQDHLTRTTSLVDGANKACQVRLYKAWKQASLSAGKIRKETSAKGVKWIEEKREYIQELKMHICLTIHCILFVFFLLWNILYTQFCQKNMHSNRIYVSRLSTTTFVLGYSRLQTLHTNTEHLKMHMVILLYT